VTLNQSIGLQPSEAEDACLFATVLRLQCLEKPEFQTSLMSALFNTREPCMQEQVHSQKVDNLLFKAGFALGQLVYDESVLDTLSVFEQEHTSSRSGNRFICCKCHLSIGANLQDLVCCSGKFPGAECVNNIHIKCARSASAVCPKSSWMVTGDWELALCPTCYSAKEQAHLLQVGATGPIRARRKPVLDPKFAAVYPAAVEEADKIAQRLFFYTAYDHEKDWQNKEGHVANTDLYLASVLEQLKETSFGYTTSTTTTTTTSTTTTT
jgi:hypothetical protein